MALLLHHRDTPTRAGTVFKSLLTLILVTALIAAVAGLVTYGVSKLFVALLSGIAS